MKQKDRIKELLEKHYIYRKSDYKLMARIWNDDIKKLHGYQNMTAKTFLDLLFHNKLTKWETATRHRRDLQRNNPELRDKDTYEFKKIRTTEHWGDFSQSVIIDAMLTATFEVIFHISPTKEVAMTQIMAAMSNFSDIEES